MRGASVHGDIFQDGDVSLPGTSEFRSNTADVIAPAERSPDDPAGAGALMAIVLPCVGLCWREAVQPTRPTPRNRGAPRSRCVSATRSPAGPPLPSMLVKLVPVARLAIT